jgi:hypothetical protein
MSVIAAANHQSVWIPAKAKTAAGKVRVKRVTTPKIAKAAPSTSARYPNTRGSTREPRMTTPRGRKRAGAATMK